MTDPATTPTVDRDNASVGLDTIIFDAIDRGSVPLSEADDTLVTRLFDAIAPIDAPDYPISELLRCVDGEHRAQPGSPRLRDPPRSIVVTTAQEGGWSPRPSGQRAGTRPTVTRLTES